MDADGPPRPVGVDGARSSSAIVERFSIPARDLNILGPIFSQSARIIVRKKAMVVNLEFIKAIITSEEVLILDPLRQEVLLFVDKLSMKLLQKSLFTNVQTAPEASEEEFPFEIQGLEIALEIVGAYLDSSVTELERDAYPALDELIRSVNTKNLKHVLSLKDNLTRFLARLQKVRDEIKQLLAGDEDMAKLYLTRKRLFQQQAESPIPASNCIVPSATHHLVNNYLNTQDVDNYLNTQDVEDLEMLLEAYFMQLDFILNKIQLLRQYIEDREAYANMKLDNQRNEMMQMQLTLTLKNASLTVQVETALAGIFGMNQGDIRSSGWACVVCSCYSEASLITFFSYNLAYRLGHFLRSFFDQFLQLQFSLAIR